MNDASVARNDVWFWAGAKPDQDQNALQWERDFGVALDRYETTIRASLQSRLEAYETAVREWYEATSDPDEDRFDRACAGLRTVARLRELSSQEGAG